MANAKSSHGLRLEIGDGADPEVFTDIAGIRDLTGPNFGVGTIETTAHDSVNKAREFIGTLQNEKDVTFEIVFDSSHATHDATTGLLSLRSKTDPTNFRLTLTDAGALVGAFAGFLTGLTPKGPVEGMNAADVTIRVSGDVALS